MDKKKSQKNAVFEIVREVLGEIYSAEKPMRGYFEHAHKSSYQETIRENLHPESYNRTKSAVIKFVNLVNSGEIQRPKNCPDEISLITYSRRILFNWLRKDLRLNGGIKYSPDSPHRKSEISAKINHSLKHFSKDKQIDALLSLYVQVAETKNHKGMKQVKNELLKRLYEIALEQIDNKKAAA